MKKTKFVAVVGALGLLASTYMTPLMAFSFGVGGAFGGAHFEVDGSETMNTSSRKLTRKKDFQAALASAYAQIIIGEDELKNSEKLLEAPQSVCNLKKFFLTHNDKILKTR